MSPLDRDLEHTAAALQPNLPEVVGVLVTGPRRVECSVCQAKPGDPCTQPTSTARTPVTWFHSRREQDATRY